MKNPNLRNALAELKKARSMAEGVTAATLLINKTAYQTGKFLYGLNHILKKPAPVTTTPAPTTETDSTLTVKPVTMEKTTVNDPESVSTKEDLSAPPAAAEKKETDPFTEGLMRIEFDLRTLRNQYDKAPTEIDKNALRFKILRLERERREHIQKHS
ncbi:hypothetical protein [Paenalcaligenes faecalis]|uniref:hypothetical protein n=1 Tax=Paenalcaligenes faecalis TaxID=2980099 RepID=UPI0022B97057|nr:hypothetical protein [Paenalcaligenes faecalis]